MKIKFYPIQEAGDNLPDGSQELPRHKIGLVRIFSHFYTFIISIIIMIIIGELLLRLFSPQRTIYPPYKFSYYDSSPRQTDASLQDLSFKSYKIVDTCPRRFKFIYTINQFGCRGEILPIQENYKKSNIIILGDSYSFGMGVTDGEEYPAIMDSVLKASFDIVNLGRPGVALGEEIRVYYELGEKYKPKIVILQFCANDLNKDIYPITTIENNKFVFHNIPALPFWKTHLIHFQSKAICQKSHLYSFLRGTRQHLRQVSNKTKEQYYNPEGEDFYNKLLENFALDLHTKEINLIIISVDGELDKYPRIKNKVLSLEAEGVLDYCEIEPWFKQVLDYKSPEGHGWGKIGHKIIGVNLAKYISENY